MPTEITMPQLSDTMSEGTVVKWLKKEGDKIRENEKIAEVETDKAVMEMEAFEGGTLAVILANEGDKIAVGQPIAVLASTKENAADVKRQYSAGRAESPAPVESAAPQPVAAHAESEASSSAVATMESASVGELHEPAEVGHGATREKASPVPRIPAHASAGKRTHASPLARRIAADKGIDLQKVAGSGPNGRIIQRDLPASAPASADAVAPAPSAAAPAPAAPVPPARVSRGQSQVIPLSKMRQAIAKGLQASKQNVPHFYVTIDVDIEALSALRARLNAELEAERLRLSLGDFISKAVAAALRKHPAVNAHFNAEKNEITRLGDVHMGFAVALPEGLIVPVLRNIDQMGLKEIRQRSADLIDRARARSSSRMN